MNYLVDTLVIINAFSNQKEIPEKIRLILINPDNKIFVSIISLWEIAIKINIKRLSLDFDFHEIIHKLEVINTEILPIKHQYLVQYNKLDLIHRDPFDRLLISTAIIENLTIITSDEKIHKYNVNWIW
jgi:PIN domain nuclease of toxin-antitoxin system